MLSTASSRVVQVRALDAAQGFDFEAKAKASLARRSMEMEQIQVEAKKGPKLKIGEQQCKVGLSKKYDSSAKLLTSRFTYPSRLSGGIASWRYSTASRPDPRSPT